MLMTGTPGKAGTGSDVAGRLAFFKGLQAITARIHAAQDIDQIVFELASELCSLFDVERLSFFTIDEAGAALVARVRIGAASIWRVR